MDARARREAAPLPRPRLHPLRSRGLAGTPRRHCRDRRGARLGDARLHLGRRALAARARRRGPRRQHPVRRGARRAGDARRGRARMKAFAALYTALDETTATNEQVAALVRYFRAARPADASWAVNFLIGRRPKRLVKAAALRQWAAEEAGIPEWLFEESYHAAGDLAETIALLLPDGTSAPDGDGSSLRYWVEERLLPLRGLDDTEQRAALVSAWRELGGRERYVWNKLITGAFRVGASARLVARALSEVSGIPHEIVAHRLMGAWEPTPGLYERLTGADTGDADASRPYPFFLAHPLEGPLESLGDAADWQAEWKWDGIRAQLVRRAGGLWVWSRWEDLLAGSFQGVVTSGYYLNQGHVNDS